MFRFFFALFAVSVLAVGICHAKGAQGDSADILVYDSFSTDRWLSNHLSDTGSGWTPWSAGGYLRGDIGIHKGVAKYNGRDAVFLSDAVPTGTDYSVEADFILDSAKNPSGYLALLARADAGSGTAYWLGYDHALRQFELYRLANGNESKLATWEDGASLPVTHRVKLALTGDTLSVYVGGELVNSITDNAVIGAPGQAGIGVSDSGSLTVLDNFTVIMMDEGSDPPPPQRGATNPDIGAKPVDDFPRFGQGRSHLVLVTEPMTLSQPNTEYVLQNDIAAPETAFFIAAHNVTLNLNGHTITYGTAGPERAVFGVRATGGVRRNVAVVNGTIAQAQTLSAEDLKYEGSHPIFGGYDQESGQSNFRGLLAAGLKIRYRTPTTCGIYNHWGHDTEIRHNTFQDEGRIISNRNQLWTAIKLAEGSGQRVHHNRITGARHGGIMVKSDAEVFQNHIEVDSADTNALGINAYAGSNIAVFNNTVLGKGVHVAGIYFGSGGADIRIFRNHVETRNTRPTVSPTDPYQSSSAFRTSFGLQNGQIYDNTFITWGKKDGVAPGVDTRGWTMFVGLASEGDSVLIRDNTILGVSEDGEGMVYAVGIKANAAGSVRFEGNLIASNYGNISLGDSYGPSSAYPVFRENILSAETGHPTHADYRTVDMKRSAGNESTAKMIANSYRQGADLHSIAWPASPSTAAPRDLGIGWIYTLTVRDAQTGEPLSGIDVTISDASGTVVFDEATDEAGRIEAELIEYWITNGDAGEPDTPFPGANLEKVGPYTVVIDGGEPRALEVRANLSEIVDL